MKKTKIEKPVVTHTDMVRMSFEEKLKRTDYFVEADSFARSALWKDFVFDKPDRIGGFDNTDKNGVEWLQDHGGFGKTVGYIGIGKSRPVVVDFSWYVIGKKYVCFYRATSRFVDWTMIEKWIKKHFKDVPMTDADNFHQCYNECRTDK